MEMGREFAGSNRHYRRSDIHRLGRFAEAVLLNMHGNGRTRTKGEE
jgi:hypothetical protein